MLLEAHTGSRLYPPVHQQLPLDIKGCLRPLALLHAMARQTQVALSTVAHASALDNTSCHI